MTPFDEFWLIADWRGLERNPVKPAAIAFNRAVRSGADPRQIIAGAIGYRQFVEQCDKDPAFRVSAAKFVAEESWIQYTSQREAKEYLEQTRLRVVGE